MNQILEGALSYFQSNQKPQYVENDKMKVQENLNQIQNGIIPGVTHLDSPISLTHLLNRIQQPKF